MNGRILATEPIPKNSFAFYVSNFCFPAHGTPQQQHPSSRATTKQMERPILYSFRRCPYAMRARMALHLSHTEYELREVDLRHKPAALLEVSPKGTVPVLILHGPDGQRVIDESMEIVRWALCHASDVVVTPEEDTLLASIATFGVDLEPYRRPYKFPEQPKSAHRDVLVARHLTRLEACLQQCDAGGYFFGEAAPFDICLFPLMRQLMRADEVWFAQEYPLLSAWLARRASSSWFNDIVMKKVDVWSE